MRAVSAHYNLTLALVQLPVYRLKNSTANRLSNWLDAHRQHLAHPNALVQLSFLGLLTGVLAGGIIVLFRVAVEGSLAGILPGSLVENYEALPFWQRFLLPLLGGLTIGAIFHRAAADDRVLGVAKVMERMAYHQGHISLYSFLLQFLGAALAIISGHSVGREGPHVFLGAAAGSLLGQFLTVPNNSIRTMVGCGTAAAIAASFNTPLAGVIFALEVIMMEYSLASFIPVILAAVSAVTISILVFENEPAMLVPELHLGSLSELPLLILLGVLAGAVSALFIQLLQLLTQWAQKYPFWQRTTLAGALVGIISLFVPEVMGIGYDTVNSALLGELGATLLAILVLFKLLATVASLGLGIPGGVIGPALFIGATLGSLMGLLVQILLPQANIDVGLYSLLGMGAVMGGSLQAPLAALTAMMELTYSPQIIMPGMLVIVVAALTASELFRKESLFITMLKANGMDYEANPIMQTLRRIGVASVMHKSFSRTEVRIDKQKAETLLAAEPEWLLIHERQEPIILMPAVDLARYIQEENQSIEHLIDLLQIPARRKQVAAINLQATLQEGLEILDGGSAEALYVERMNAPGIRRIYGVLTREQVESAYRY